MNPLQQKLRDADPVTVEPPLSDIEIQVMRREVVAAAPDVQTPTIAWHRFILTAATLAVVIAGLTSLARRPANPVTQGAAVTVSEPGVRQLQFSAPGGTRVIWIFNPEFPQ